MVYYNLIKVSLQFNYEQVKSREDVRNISPLPKFNNKKLYMSTVSYLIIWLIIYIYIYIYIYIIYL